MIIKKSGKLEFSSIKQIVKENWIKLFTILFATVIISSGIGMKTYLDSKNKVLPQETPIQKTHDDSVYTLSENDFDRYSEIVIRSMYNHKEYVDRSILMNIDPFEIPTVYVSFLIDDYSIEELNEEGKALLLNSIKSAYGIELKSEKLYEAVKNELGLDIENKYLGELINGELISGATFNIKIIYSDRQTCENISLVVEKYVLGLQNQVSEKVAKHTLLANASVYTVEADTGLEAKQRAELSKNIYYAGSGTTEAIINSMRLITDYNKIAEQSQKISFNIVLLYGFIGAVLAAVIMIGYIVFKCSKDNRIFDYLEIKSSHDCKFLDISDYAKTKKDIDSNNNPLVLYDLEGLLLDIESQELLIVSPGDTVVPDSWDKIFEKLKIKTKKVFRFLENTNNLDMLKEAHEILIICKRNQTTYTELDYIVRRTTDRNIHMAGIIIE